MTPTNPSSLTSAIAEVAPEQDEQARQLVRLASRAFKRDRPLFILVQYNHEADKLTFLENIKTRLNAEHINTRHYDPLNHVEHGVSELYPLLKSDATEQILSLVVSMPRAVESDGLAADFLSYINLHRDSIAENKLHWVLFLRESEMAAFIRGASDLWSFCHRTFWLERPLEKSADMLWHNIDSVQESLPLTDEENQQIKDHIGNIQQLVGETEDNEAKARLLLDLTRWLIRQNTPQMAVEVVLAGIALCKAEGGGLLGLLANAAGQVFDVIGAYPDALTHFTVALTISEQLNDQAREGIILNNIAQVYLALGDYDKALSHSQKSLMIRRQFDDLPGESSVLDNIGLIYEARGDYQTALDYLNQSLKVARDTSDDLSIGQSLNGIGSIYLAQCDYDGALDYFKQALVIWQSMGHERGVAGSLNNIASIYYNKEDFDAAIEYFHQALEMNRKVGNKEGEGTNLANIAQLYSAKGDYAAGLNYAQKAVSLHLDIGNKAGLCMTFISMGDLHWQNDQPNEALAVWTKAYRLAKSMGLAQALDALADLAENVGLSPGLAGWEQLSLEQQTK